MCRGAKVADPGEQRRRLSAAGDEDGGDEREEAALTRPPTMTTMWRRRQAQEMSAMVSALAMVVAGAGEGASSTKRPAEQEAFTDEPWWSTSYGGGTAAAPSASSFLPGTYTRRPPACIHTNVEHAQNDLRASTLVYYHSRLKQRLTTRSSARFFLCTNNPFLVETQQLHVSDRQKQTEIVACVCRI